MRKLLLILTIVSLYNCTPDSDENYQDKNIILQRLNLPASDEAGEIIIDRFEKRFSTQQSEYVFYEYEIDLSEIINPLKSMNRPTGHIFLIETADDNETVLSYIHTEINPIDGDVPQRIASTLTRNTDLLSGDFNIIKVVMESSFKEQSSKSWFLPD